MTKSVIDTLCVRLPLTPVIVRVEVLVGVFILVLTESVDEELDGLGLKPTVAPLGRPLTLKLTWPASPFTGVIDTE